ncbi:MAG: phospholipase D-like domain-containing protein [Pseudobdellovibrio sp.]
MSKLNLLFVRLCLGGMLIFFSVTQAFAGVGSFKNIEDNIQSIANNFPVELKNAWSAVGFKDIQLAKFSKGTGKSLKCLRLSNYIVPDVSHRGAAPLEYKVLQFSKECSEEELLVRLEKDVYRVATEIWFKSNSNSKQNKLIKALYKSRIFNSALSTYVNLSQKLEDLTVDFVSYAFQSEDFRKSQKDIRTYLSQMSTEQVLARTKVLYHSDEAWFYRFKLLKEAKESITIQSYSLFDDLYGRSTVYLLLEALSRGVKVKLMLDGRGSILVAGGGLLQLLKEAGAEVKIYNPLIRSLINPFKFFQAGFLRAIISANHDKIFMVDDRKVIVGGRNIGTRYFANPDEIDGLSYQDMDVYLESEKPILDAVIAFNTEFYSKNSFDAKSFRFDRVKEENKVMTAYNYMSARLLGTEMSAQANAEYQDSNRILNLDKYGQYDFTPSINSYPVEGVDKLSSIEDTNVLTESLIEDIDNAQESITIVNPYVILTKELKDAFDRAWKRNKNLKIKIVTVTPKTTDSKFTQAYFIKEWKNVLKNFPNVEIFGYIGHGNLHAKVFIFDEKSVYIGSYNLDKLSQNINSEFSFKIFSPDIILEVKQFISEQFIANSIKYDLDQNIGPKQADFNGKYVKMKRFTWIAKLLSPWL